MAHLWREEEGLSPVAHTSRKILAWGCWAVAGKSEACSSIFPLIRHKVCRWDELFRKGQPNTASSESRNWSHLFFTLKKGPFIHNPFGLFALQKKLSKQKEKNKDWRESAWSPFAMCLTVFHSLFCSYFYQSHRGRWPTSCPLTFNSFPAVKRQCKHAHVHFHTRTCAEEEPRLPRVNWGRGLTKKPWREVKVLRLRDKSYFSSASSDTLQCQWLTWETRENREKSVSRLVAHLLPF